MRKPLTLTVAGVLAGLVPALAVAEVDWVGGLPAALDKAAQADRPVLVDFYTDWCGWCKKLDAEVYTDERVEKLLAEAFICVKVDGDTETELVGKYEVDGYPTVIILDADGVRLKTIGGFEPADLFLIELRDALDLRGLRAEGKTLQGELEGASPERAPEINARLAYIERRLGNMAAAADRLAQAKAAGLDTPEVRLNEALLIKAPAARATALSAWLDANPGSPYGAEAFFELGMAQAQQRKWTEAVASLEKATAEAPTSIWSATAQAIAKVIRDRFIDRPEGMGDATGGCCGQ